MTRAQMEKLSDEELLKISLRTNKKGVSTKTANIAMSIRRERNGHWDGVGNRPPSKDYQEILYQGCVMD